jgi:hypothetical protein
MTCRMKSTALVRVRRNYELNNHQLHDLFRIIRRLGLAFPRWPVGLYCKICWIRT